MTNFKISLYTRYLFLLLFIFSVGIISAQKYAYKLGEVSMAELEANVFAKDTTADAVIISEYAYRTISSKKYTLRKRLKTPEIPSRGFAQNRYYDMIPYVLETEFQRKVKILKSGGLSQATVEIPFYNIHSPYREELIEGVEAWSYVLQNGEIVRNKLKKEDVRIVRMNDTLSQVQFTIPNAKVGGVLEYKFKRVTSMEYANLNWEFQSDIPTMFSIYETFYYDAFVVNQEIKGPFEIKTHAETEHPGFTDVSQNEFAGRNARRILYVAQDIPAFKKVDRIWCMKDYTPGVRSELLATRYMGYVPYADKWEDVENRVSVESQFNKNNYGSMFYGKELKALLKPIKSEREKIEAIYRFVKKKIKWNGVYSLYDEPQEAVNKGVGSNSQINAVLMRALYRNKFYVYPILVNLRSEGRFPASFPTYERIKTYIICVHTSDGEKYYLDGSAEYGGLNMLPSDLMTDNGRTLARSFMLSEGQSNGNVNLTDINSADTRVNITGRLDENGRIKGQLEQVYGNLSAMFFRENIHRNKTSNLRNEAEKLGQISDYQLANHLDNLSDKVTENFGFSIQLQQSGEKISFNPLLFSSFLFKEQLEEGRTLPVEFDVPKSIHIHSEIEIPENYEFIQHLQPAQEKLSSGAFDFQYTIAVQDGKIVTDYVLNMREVVFAPTDFDELRKIFYIVVEKNQEKVLLKKR